MSWNREKDAWIARHCEELEAEYLEDEELWLVWPAGSKHLWAYCDSYNTDPAAAIRAAEAWRVKDPSVDRTIELLAAVERMGMPCTVTLAENYPVGDRYGWRKFEGKASNQNPESWSAAISQALLRATGWTEKTA